MMRLSRVLSLLTTRNSISLFRSSMTAGYLDNEQRHVSMETSSTTIIFETGTDYLTHLLWEWNGLYCGRPVTIGGQRFTCFQTLGCDWRGWVLDRLALCVFIVVRIFSSCGLSKARED